MNTNSNDEVRTITDKQLHRVFLEGVKTSMDAAARYCEEQLIATLTLTGDALTVVKLLRKQFVDAARETQTAIDELTGQP